MGIASLSTICVPLRMILRHNPWRNAGLLAAARETTAMPNRTLTPKKKKKAGPLRKFLRILGPGLITGAADDDPSGIATYSIAGAQFGTSMLWTAFLTWPLMAAVQMMCARIGMVSGSGLADALRKKFPRSVVAAAALALLVANTANIGADLAAMADGAEM